MLNGTPDNTSINETASDDELYQMVEDFPYYASAQFYLLARLKKNNDTNFDHQLYKTALFFPNQRWLNHELVNYNIIIDKGDNEIHNNTLDHTDNREITPNVDKDTPDVDKDKNLPLQKTNTTNSTAEAVAFEPLYTVDYFASQGIKISEETISNDKLGTQLKSFTEWLKSMKKLTVQNSSLNDEQTDKIIQHIAEGSNTNSNIVTEAMAEVLIKQNKVEQAIDIYEKLILTYPSKSAYFASKITSLKS